MTGCGCNGACGCGATKRPADSDTVRKLRDIAAEAGPRSASAKALTEYDARRTRGERVDIIIVGTTIVVTEL